MTTNAKALAISAMLKDCTPAELLNAMAMACDELDGREIANAVREHTSMISLELEDLESIIEAATATPAELGADEAEGLLA